MDQNHTASVYLPWIGTAAAVAFAVYVTLKAKRGQPGAGFVNPRVQKDLDKVVHTFDVEDMGKKTVFCRCWRSSKFPYCDGSHNNHNNVTGDNVGPLIVQKKD